MSDDDLPVVSAVAEIALAEWREERTRRATKGASLVAPTLENNCNNNPERIVHYGYVGCASLNAGEHEFCGVCHDFKHRKRNMADIGIDMKDVKAKARKELNDEVIKKATKAYKELLVSIRTAENVVHNLRRELEALEDEMEHGVF